MVKLILWCQKEQKCQSNHTRYVYSGSVCKYCMCVTKFWIHYYPYIAVFVYTPTHRRTHRHIDTFFNVIDIFYQGFNVWLCNKSRACRAPAPQRLAYVSWMKHINDMENTHLQKRYGNNIRDYSCIRYNNKHRSRPSNFQWPFMCS